MRRKEHGLRTQDQYAGQQTLGVRGSTDITECRTGAAYLIRVNLVPVLATCTCVKTNVAELQRERMVPGKIDAGPQGDVPEPL